MVSQSTTSLSCYSNRSESTLVGSELPIYAQKSPAKIQSLRRHFFILQSALRVYSALCEVFDSDYTWWSLIFLLWIGLNAANVTWIYYYIRAYIYPNPRTAVNLTHAGFDAYAVFMYLFGTITGAINYFVCSLYFQLPIHRWSAKNIPDWLMDMLWLFHGFVVVLVAIVLVFGGVFSPIVALPLTQKHAWSHGCDNYPVQVILDGRTFGGPEYTANTAHFFQGTLPLYTYDLFQSSASDWLFNLRTIHVPNLNQSSLDHPSISNVTYNFKDFTVSGNCTSPSSAETAQCISGSFNPNNFLSFSLYDLRANTTLNLRAVDNQWAFRNDPPSVLLKDDGGTEILKTDVTKYGDCTQLKMCAGMDTGPGIIVPMALILIRQSEYAIKCTDST